jgi:hypothetical protein
MASVDLTYIYQSDQRSYCRRERSFVRGRDDLASGAPVASTAANASSSIVSGFFTSPCPTKGINNVTIAGFDVF